MAINERDFYASHGLDFDVEKMQIEYTKRVIKQAKIEVLTELQTEIEELPMYYDPLDISDLIQQKINTLTEDKKEQYEARLKADMVNMLEELDFRLSNYQGTDLLRQDIQEKINKLKGEEDGDNDK